MRFSQIQEKEIIEAGNGKFLGYVVDAEISQETGMIVAFVIEQPKRLFSFWQADDSRCKILLEDVLVVGKDVILVKDNRSHNY